MVQNTFELRLNKKPFESIKNGEKTIEMRLYDEKRQQINIGDYIIFKERDNEENQIKVIVEDMDIYANFEELYKNHDKQSLGYKDDEPCSYKDMEMFYSLSEQDMYGLVDIKVSLIKE